MAEYSDIQIFRLVKLGLKRVDSTAFKWTCLITFKRQPILNLHRIILLHVLTEHNNLILQASAIIASAQEITRAFRAFRTVHTAA